MSIDIRWETITSGSDGAALAEQIRAFVHEKFQQIPLPRFIKAVHVHSFEFGTVCPEIEIKDICDPLPDFYEDDDESEGGDDATEPHAESDKNNLHDPSNHDTQLQAQPFHQKSVLANVHTNANHPGLLNPAVARDFHGLSADHLNGPFPRSTTPGIPGGTSNLSYFHFPGSGLSGTQTPLAAVASGTPFTPRPWAYDLPQHPASAQRRVVQPSPQEQRLHVHDDPSTRPSTANSISSLHEPGSALSSPQLQHTTYPNGQNGVDESALDDVAPLSPSRLHSRQPSDVQIVTRVKYSGDVRMTLTAEILLDYPMPSFVGIPLKLAITGMSFDGVAIIAWVQNKMHFCFLDSEDASTLVGEDTVASKPSKDGTRSTLPGPLQEIHVESEIGRQEEGKQVLKNVGKVEKFVLEEVRKIFEEEFVFPSSWTILV